MLGQLPEAPMSDCQPLFPPILSPGPILSMASEYWRSCTLHAGVRLDVFTALANGPRSPKGLAPELGCDERALGMLLNALAALDLLVKEDGEFSLTEASAAFLVKGSPRYQGHIITHHSHLVDSFGRMAESIKSGGPNRQRTVWDDEGREAFLMGMFNLAMGIAPGLAERLDALLTGAGYAGMERRRAALDLGGGPGTYAIHFCLAHPGLRATVFDLPTTRPFAEGTAARFGVADRVRFEPGDYTADPVPADPAAGGYDLAWLSQILHGEDPASAAEVVRKGAEALRPGGVLLVHEFLLDDTLDGPEFAALFSLNMLLGTRGGQSYSGAQVREMLEGAGLTEVRRLDFAGPNRSGIIAGVKPGA